MSSAMCAELFARAQRVAPGGVHSPVRAFRGVGGIPRFMQSAHAARLVDVAGRSYLDFCLAWGALLTGHQDEDVQRAVSAALRRGWVFGTADPYSLELAEFITAHIPWVQKLRFTNSGTEAVMAAVRVARAATGRTQVVKYSGCYHGHADGMLVKAGSGLAEAVVPDSAGVSAACAAETWVLPLDDDAATQRLFAQRGSEIAAVIIEPLPANNGLLIQREEFVRGVVAAAHRAGALVILDEVITGFRVAFGGMTERLQLKPDLVTYGKILGGGFPVGAVGGRADLMDLIAPAGPVYQAGTFSANPIGMCAGLAMLKKLKELAPYAALERETTALARALRSAVERLPGCSLQVQQLGSLFWLVYGAGTSADGPAIRTPDAIPADHSKRFARLFHALLGRGMYLAPSGFETHFLSTAHSLEDLAQF
ncbi:MAG TPA: glutamate-1-semialdehyde 2,1-aminomutase, partial [Steroidobacteraceae bacterium]